MNKDSGFLDELLVKTDLVQLISEYVPLTKSGSTFWGCCPFHHEKTPSFSVNQSKQLYHCFGCHAGGNAITFIKNIESVEPFEAVKILCKRVGMEVPQTEYTKKSSGESAKIKERLYRLMRDAAKRYHENLLLASAQRANEYLKKRGLDAGIIKRFGLGYSTDGQDMLNYLISKGYTEKEIKDSGILAVSEHGAYDTFYERLIFPIINNINEVVAFGGRILTSDTKFKYKNSPQTIIFDKSKTIYAINLLKKKKMRERLDYIILCEGYMDVISLHQAGFDSAVASMGTSLTFNQAKQLKNHCDKVYICYDGDSAGQSATLRGLDILCEAGLNVRVVELPVGLDPDDVIKKHGNNFFQGLLDKALTLTLFKLESLKKQYDLTDISQRAKFGIEAVKVIKKLENPVEHEEYFKIVQSYTGYTMQALENQAKQEKVEPKLQEPSQVETADNDALSMARKFILASVAHGAGYAREDGEYEKLRTLLQDDFSKIFLEYYMTNSVASIGEAALYNKLDESYHDRLSAIINYRFIIGDGVEKYNDCKHLLERELLLQEKQMLEKAFEDTKDTKILIKIQNINNKLAKSRMVAND